MLLRLVQLEPLTELAAQVVRALAEDGLHLVTDDDDADGTETLQRLAVDLLQGIDLDPQPGQAGVKAHYVVVPTKGSDERGDGQPR